MKSALMILEAHLPDTNWNDNSMLAICTEFIDDLGLEQVARFEQWVADRAAAEAANELG